MRAEELYAQVKLWAGKKQEIPDMLSLMNLWYRDVLVAKAANGSNMVLFKEEKNELMRQAEAASYTQLELKLNAIEQMKQRMNANVSLEVALELLFLSLK